MMWMCVLGSVTCVEGAGVIRSPPYVVGSSRLYYIVWDVWVFGVGADEAAAHKRVVFGTDVAAYCPHTAARRRAYEL